MSTNEIFVDMHEFDPERVVLDDPVVHEYKIGNETMKVTRSSGYYLDDNGKKCALFFAGGKQECGFGVGVNYPMGTKDEDQTPDKIQGYQISYSGTSMATMNEPTDDEAYTLGVFDGLYKKSLAHIRDVYEREEDRKMNDEDAEPLIPAVSYNSIMAVEKSGGKKKNWGNALKRPFAHPKKTDPKNPKRKIEDPEKPLRAYFKIISKGKGEDCIPQTKFYGPGDIPHSATKYIGVRGEIIPLFKWDGVYWGQHGNTSPVGASMTFKLAEAVYTPTAGGGGLASRRMLRKNLTPVVENDDTDDSFSHHTDTIGGEEEGFASPGDAESPAEALQTVKKSKTKKKKTKKKKTPPPSSDEDEESD